MPKIFFYGLFMDTKILASKGIRPTIARPVTIDGYGLTIGARASLVKEEGGCTHGILMSITPDEETQLYASEGVEDYRAITIPAAYDDGSSEDVVSYVLPPDKVSGTNAEYAKALLLLAKELKFPKAYLERIKSFTF